MSTKAKGINLEMLTVKSILRQLGKLPVARQGAVLNYVSEHLQAILAQPEYSGAVIESLPQLHIAQPLTGAARKS